MSDTIQKYAKDTISGYLITIDDIHARIHQGVFFEANNLTLNVAVASPKKILLVTGGTKVVHLSYDVETGAGGAKLELYEGTTVSDTGTPITSINENRLSTNTAEMQVFDTPTVTNDGTQIDIHQSGTTTAGGKLSGHVGFNREFILKKSTNYQLKITTLAQVDVSTEIDWYEI